MSIIIEFKLKAHDSAPITMGDVTPDNVTRFLLSLP